MKNIKKYSIILTLATLIGACDQYTIPELPQPAVADLDFTKMVSVGNSLTAGFMNGALYTAGQNTSYVSALSKQLALVGGGTFNVPSVNSDNGCFNPAGGCTLGRLKLKIVNGSPAPVPLAGDGNASLAPFAGKATLNNFGVPGVTIGSAQSPALAANPYYARIASNPGSSTLIGDAKAAMSNGTFFTFWLGNNDALGYATAGASAAGTLTSPATFQTLFNLALTEILNAKADAEGAVANIPDVTSAPFFSTVVYNPIPLSAESASALTSLLANNYNAFLTGMVANLIITAEEATKRRLTYKAGQNAILITDETLTDLTPYMAGPYAGLLPYAKARQTTSTDLVCLTAASYLGADLGGGAKNGVTAPLINTSSAGALSLKGDDLILIPSEITEIQNAVTQFNTSIAAAVSAQSSRLVLIDVNSALKDLKAGKVSVNGSALAASILPPFGAFSLDGVHPNARGSAYIANLFITAINAKWGSSIPLCNPNDYPSNELPTP